MGISEANRNKHVSELININNCYSVIESSDLIQPKPGIYSIFIDKTESIPIPFSDVLITSNMNLLYIGIASKSLYKRLFQQDLRHKNPSTFFRGMGAILGYRPPIGSLVGAGNQNNYRFSDMDTREIINWMDSHLLINWLYINDALKGLERNVIRKYKPVLNTTYNPYPSRELKRLRECCRNIAKKDPN